MQQELLERLSDMGAEVEDTIERLMSDEKLYIEYVLKFPKNQNIIELQKAVEAKDAEKALKEVHTLKGVALNLGFLPLIDVCMDMVLELRAGREEEAFAMTEEVVSCFRELSDVILEYQE